MSVPVGRRDEILRRMERDGFWYPPDLINAVADGRDRYWSLGGPESGVEWPISRILRGFVRRYLDAPEHSRHASGRFW